MLAIDLGIAIRDNHSRPGKFAWEVAVKRQTVFVAVLAASVAAHARGEEAVNAKNLVGTWTCVSAVIDGKPLAGETAGQLRLTLTPDRYKTERGDQVLFDSTYKVDVTKSPAQIDMIGTEGDLKDKAALGILKLDGDMLTMCYVMPGKERPAAFESQPQSGAFLVVWKRAASK
jgi:uncharacterized protein (TIGR03067 family)